MLSAGGTLEDRKQFNLVGLSLGIAQIDWEVQQK